MRVHDEYEKAPAIQVAASLPHSNIQALEVRFLSSSPPRASVLPPYGTVKREHFWIGPLDWMANSETIRPVYDEAVRTAMRQSGRDCDIAGSWVFPDLYMIDYTLKCRGPAQ